MNVNCECVVLEVYNNEFQGKTYHSLVIYELNQKRFPQVKILRLFADKVEEASKLIGKRAMVVADLYIDQKAGGKMKLTYVGTV